MRAPHDLAVIGVDDIAGAATAQPPLTTVVRDVDALAHGLARRVVDALDRKQTSADPIRDPLRVHVRGWA
ncbi:substrate-binding domain-containing protein [Streptomyces sp. NPDC058291]|uniref:substrate-binding domain-containing protein n=1 Tax=Streptomyces sp. NPDC058291 TaxID=3346427 RepID=UPI0036F1507B